MLGGAASKELSRIIVPALLNVIDILQISQYDRGILENLNKSGYSEVYSPKSFIFELLKFMNHTRTFSFVFHNPISKFTVRYITGVSADWLFHSSIRLLKPKYRDLT